MGDQPVYVTIEEFTKFRRALAKHLDRRFGEVYSEIAAGNDAEAKLADEAIEKAERAQRHARRVEKKLNEHDHE